MLRKDLFIISVVAQIMDVVLPVCMSEYFVYVKPFMFVSFSPVLPPLRDEV